MSAVIALSVGENRQNHSSHEV